MANERLAQFNTFQENHLGFRGITAGVADELIPDGYVPDMENVKITIEGIAAAIPNPTKIAPPAGITAEPTSIFVWQTDAGINYLLAQWGVHLYIRKGTPLAWVEIRRAGDVAAFASIARASYAAGMDDKIFIAQEDTQCSSYDGTTLVALWNGPMGRYITLWKNRLFIGYIKKFYGLAASAAANGSEQTAVGGALQSAVMWSNINLAEVAHLTLQTYDNGWSTLSLLVLKTPENSVCTGLLPAQETLIMFTKSAIFKFSGYSDTTFTSYDSYHGTSTPMENAAVGAEGVFYISNDGFFVLNSLKTEYDSPKKISETIKTLISVSAGTVSCAYFDGRIWFCTGGTLVTLNSITTAWEKYVLGGLYGATDVGTQKIIYAADHLYAGTSGGYILVVDVASTVDVGYRPWYVQAPALNQGITSAQKRYKALTIYTKNTPDKMRLSYSLDFMGDRTIPSPLEGAVIGNLWGTMLWGTGTWSVDVTSMNVYKRYIVAPPARTIGFRFYGTGDAGLLGYSIVYTPKRKFGIR